MDLLRKKIAAEGAEFSPFLSAVLCVLCVNLRALCG